MFLKSKQTKGYTIERLRVSGMVNKRIKKRAEDITKRAEELEELLSWGKETQKIIDKNKMEGKSMELAVDRITPREKMEHFFGFDKINPIVINSSEDKEMLESGDWFKDWYEEELEDLCKKYE